jgi:hypothetical protein
VWALHSRHGKATTDQWVLPVAAVLVLVSPMVLVAGLSCAATVAVGLTLDRVQRRRGAAA